MTARRSSVTLGMVLAAGVAIGWAAGASRPARLLADGADRWGDRALAAGPIGVEVIKDIGAFEKDALYYLNYSTGMLFAAVPSFQATVGQAQTLSEFAQRDLMADFGIKPGQDPHFLMTTARLGRSADGWSPLFVFETETGQVATYRVTSQATAGSTRPAFELIGKKVDRRLGRVIAAASR